LKIWKNISIIRRLFRDGDDKMVKQDIKLTISSSAVAVVSSSVAVFIFVFDRLLSYWRKTIDFSIKRNQ
jgi:hypothetical protein